ncbi:MAG: hypothetical protein DMF79_01715 [Acidobacteria bacterium]|nr:MAG: hypothetical protein DMF79_01715 [Acidobacteriota bacterium]
MAFRGGLDVLGELDGRRGRLARGQRRGRGAVRRGRGRCGRRGGRGGGRRYARRARTRGSALARRLAVLREAQQRTPPALAARHKLLKLSPRGPPGQEGQTVIA